MTAEPAGKVAPDPRDVELEILRAEVRRLNQILSYLAPESVDEAMRRILEDAETIKRFEGPDVA